MALLWLTVGFSFAYNHTSAHVDHHIALKDLSKDGNTDIPFEKSSEEKADSLTDGGPSLAGVFFVGFAAGLRGGGPWLRSGGRL